VGRTRRFTLGVPYGFTIARAGRAVLFLRSRAGDDPTTCLWALDLANPAANRPVAGTLTSAADERLLADPAELTGTAGGPGISGLTTDRAGDLVAFTLAGGIWLIDLREPRDLPDLPDSQDRPDRVERLEWVEWPGRVERVEGRVRRVPVGEPAVGVWLEPGGRWVAYGCRGELRLIGVDGSGDRAVATPEGPDVGYGAVEEAGLVAVGGAEACWWAPGGDRLLVARVDSSGVERWYLGNPAEPTEAPPSVRYAAAGKANADVSLWLVDAAGGTPVEVRWEHEPFEYLVNAGWDGHGPYVAVQSRDQRTVRFLTVETASGATAVAAEWRDPRWVGQVPGLPARTGSGALVAHLDDGETRHLAVAGAPVTPAGLQLRAVHGIDGDEVLFGASEDPTETHLWSYHPDRGLRRLTTDPAVHTGTTRDGTLAVVTRDDKRPGGRVTAWRHSRPAGAGAPHRAGAAGRTAGAGGTRDKPGAGAAPTPGQAVLAVLVPRR
jgi:dipeptidyl-peptidase-4